MSKKDKKKQRGQEPEVARARDRPAADIRAQTHSSGIRLVYPRRTSLAAVEMSTSEVIYSAVSRIANGLAVMPIHLYNGESICTNDPRELLLSLRPNSRMSAFAFKRAMEIYRCTEGRAYAVKRFDDTGKLRELVVYDPRMITPLIERETGDVWYAIRREDDKIEYVHNWYVIALHHMSMDGLSSIRVLDVLRGSLDYSAQVKELSLKSLEGINGGIVMHFPTEMGVDHRKRAVKEFVEMYRESGGQVLALESGVTAHMLTGSAIDPDSFDVEQITRSRAATVYGMAPYLLGDYSGATGGTAEERTIEFLTSTMQPDVVQWEEELDYKLLTPEDRAAGYAFRFDTEAYLRMNGAALASVRQSQIRSGTRTPNELRKKDRLPGLPGGDCAYLSKDLAPMNLVAEGRTISADEINGSLNAKKGDKKTDNG